jgi:hypothetical protein
MSDRTPPERLPVPAAVVRITVPLVEKAAADLVKIADRTGLSRADIVNRALSLYEYLYSEMRTGTVVIVIRGGRQHGIEIL